MHCSLLAEKVIGWHHATITSVVTKRTDPIDGPSTEVVVERCK
jgi:hypothetical protein